MKLPLPYLLLPRLALLREILELEVARSQMPHARLPPSMARVLSLLRLLLLLLLCQSLPQSRAGTQIEHVQGNLGDTKILPCHLSRPNPNSKLIQITWMRQERSGASRKVAVFHPQRGPNISNSDRVEFVVLGKGQDLQLNTSLDVSLRVKGLLAQDEAIYICEVAFFPDGSPPSKQVQLQVISKAENKIQPLEVTQSPKPMAVASCISTGGRPPANISWISALGGKNNQSQEPGPLPGTVTVISHLILTPSSELNNKTVTCQVEQEKQNLVKLSVNLSVLYAPQVNISQSDDIEEQDHNQVTLTCDAHGNPKPEGYNWSTTTGPLPPYAEPQGARLLLQRSEEPINITFICLVSNPLGMAQATKRVDLPGIPREQSQLQLALTIIISIVIVLVVLAGIGILIWCCRFKKSRENRRISVNGASYSAARVAVDTN